MLVLAISELSQSSIWKSLVSATAGTAITLAFRPDVGIVLVYITLFLVIWIAAGILIFSFWRKVAFLAVGASALVT